MEVHDEFVPEDMFETFVDRMPQACVEVLLDDGDGILVAKRSNKPARGEWFWPGSRLYKGETLEAAAHRIAREELGIEVEILDQLGVYSHYWETSAVGDGPSRHTVNIVFHVVPRSAEFDIELDDQHFGYRFLTEIEPDLHEYVRHYLTDNDLLE